MEGCRLFVQRHNNRRDRPSGLLCLMTPLLNFCQRGFDLLVPFIAECTEKFGVVSMPSRPRESL